MRKTLILSALAAMLPLTMNAQDDMYFVPTKKNVEKNKSDYGMPKDTYYSGSKRSIDEYNRRNRTECWEEQLKDGSQVVAIDSLGNEIATVNVKKKKSRRDSTYVDDDYAYTRRMARWDGYECNNAYWQGYNDGRFNRWYGWSSFYDPWYYNSWYYDPWYYDPWYYGYAGWHGGWYAGWYGWHGWHPYYSWGWGWHDHYYPVYGGGSSTRYYGTGRAGTDNHGSGKYGRPASAFGSGRSISSGIANRDRSSRTITRSGTSNRFNNNRSYSYQRDNINASSGRSYSSSSNSRSSSSSSSRSSSFSSGSSFGGGSRSGGISTGGTRSGGISRGGRR